jgi:hypothetical protein
MRSFCTVLKHTPQTQLQTFAILSQASVSNKARPGEQIEELMHSM